MSPDTPENPPDNGLDPNEIDADAQPTQPLPEVTPEAAAAAGADAPTARYDAVAATADDPIAPYVPIANPTPVEGGAPPPPRDRKSPIPWLIGAAVLLMAAAIALALWQPWAGGQPGPTTTPTPSQTVTPTIPPVEPTEAPTSVPEPSEEPAPEPTQAPEPDPAPTEITPTPTPTQTVEPTVEPTPTTPAAPPAP